LPLYGAAAQDAGTVQEESGTPASEAQEPAAFEPAESQASETIVSGIDAQEGEGFDEDGAVENTEDNAEEVSSVKRWLNKTTFSFGASILVFQEDYGFDAAPVPILPAPSIAFMLPPLGSGFMGGALELTLDMYFTHYKYSYELNRPVPAEIENRSAFVLGSVLALQVQGYFRVNKFRLRLNAGIAGDFRLVLLAEDLNEADLDDANKQKDEIIDFFSQIGQILFPTVCLGMDFQITPHWAGGIDLRVWAPSDFSGIDEQFLGWRFGIGFRAFKKANFFETPVKLYTIH
jgi:hypothetical protein